VSEDPATWEAEAGGLLEPRRSRPFWVTVKPPSQNNHKTAKKKKKKKQQKTQKQKN
jgi:hypothetical protein